MLVRAGEMLNWPAQRYPDRVALSYQGRHWTFRQVDERINRLANALLGLGLGSGDRVATLQANSPYGVETRFAVMKAGLCIVALNVRQAPAEHAYILNHSESSVLVLDADYLPVWRQIEAQCPGVRHVLVPEVAPPAPLLAYEELLAASSPVAPEVMVAPDDLERIAYTSGTTGRPKGIMKTIGNDLARLRNDFLNEDLATTADDVMLNVAPLTHAARNILHKYYVKGARNIILHDFREAEVLGTIAAERVTATMLVPTMLIRLVVDPTIGQYDLTSLRRIFYGTAPMPADKLREAIGVFGNILRQNYGLSEATQPVLYLSPDDLPLDDAATLERRLASAGRPALGVEVRLADEGGREVPTGEEGELWIRGDIVMKGYWHDPEATREVLDTAGWLHTGDVARRDGDGFVTIVGREKEMIISGGFNIYPREVEQVIEGHPAVQEVAVIGVPDPVWGESVKAVVVARPGFSVTAEEIIALCSQQIASYKKPRSVDLVSELPKNFQGKVMKRELRDTYWQGRERRV
jgi:acyl-CoA synthetase (AMP-forming)/AMP-acid ligase II